MRWWATTGDPLLGHYHGQGFSVGYPASWVVEHHRSVPPWTMTASPFGLGYPGLGVRIAAAGVPPQEAARKYLRSLAHYDDLVLERSKVAVHGAATGYLLHALYSQISTDSERVPIEETTLFTTTGRGQTLSVQVFCDPGECGPREPMASAVMASVTTT